ncbi:MAG: sodium:solute symporter, partial [Ignavibacteriales bacterium]|nr:sodium:solute symporter [Ignavibacteriales bacterium]
MIPASFFWTAAQIRAFGTVLSTTTDITLTTGVVAATCVVILYTSFGGMLADVITDFIQGCILIIGLLLLFVPIISEPDSFTFIAESISSHSQSDTSSFLATAERWLIPICGSIFAQELISRVLSSRSGNVARTSSLVASGMYVLVGLMPLSIGLIGSVMMPGVENGEQILPMMAQKYLSSGMYVIFSGAIISAILSTVDSTLLAISGLTSHNILLP